MPMTSQQVAQMMAAQQSQFAGYASYAQQITPPHLMQGGAGYAGNPVMGYQGGMPQPSPHGAMIGMPSMAPMQMMSPTSTQALQSGFLPAMAQMGMGTLAPGTGASQVLGERLVGTGVNAAQSVGTGLGWLSAGAGMASMVGVGGVGAAALGGLPAMAAIGAGAYAVDQIGQGVQQRQQVNRVLRSRFGGMMGVGRGRGGTGFSAEETGAISSMVREMGTQDIFSNMEELTRVMDKTAQMGMYRGVQNAQQFQRRFRETVKSLRTVAETMQTSLEEAADFMQQGRQMGFFTGREINANMMQTRFGAQATGMSVGQVVRQGQIGAQMGRAMGMRGRVGASALQNMTMNTAMGMRMGVFSDEMMAEATGGLQGSEAAQAWAQTQFQANQRFLRRGEGRVTLAGLWDAETGGIDRAALRRFQAGRMGLRELRSRGRANINQTGGRMSEFFSNEERLRGQLQEAGGGGLMIGAIAEHFSRRRGVSIEDPIVQRFMRRRYGYTQSQMELAVREWQRAPEIMETRRARESQAMQTAVRGRAMETAGISGLGRRLSQKWDRAVSQPLEEVGDRLTTRVSRAIREMTDDMEGRINTHMTEQTKQAYKEFAMFGEQLSGGRGTGTGGGRLMFGKNLDTAMENLRSWRRPSQQGVLGMLGGAGGGGYGGFGRTLARGIGRFLGTRPDEDVYEQAENLGLGRRDVLDTFYLKGKGGRARLAGVGDVQAAVRGANRVIMGSPESLGIEDDALKRLGRRTLLTVTEAMSGMGQETQWQQRRGRATGAEKKRMLQERIQMLSRDQETADLFAAAKGDWAKQVGILRTLEQEAKLDTTAFSSGAGPSGVSQDRLEDVMDAIKEKRESALTGLASLRFKAKRRVRVEGGGILSGGGGRWEVKEEEMALSESPELVRQLMQNQAVSENFRAFRFGSSDQAQEALANLRRMASDEEGELTQQQRTTLKRMTRKEITKTKESSRQLKHFLGRYLQAEDMEQSVAVRLREKELGGQLMQSLEENQYRFEQEGMGDAYLKIKEIAEARALGKTKLAMQRERELFADPNFAKNEELQDIMAKTPGLEYLQAGMGAAARITEELTRKDRRVSKVGRLIQLSLRTAGLEDLGIKAGGKELKLLSGLVKAGKQDEVMARLRQLAEAKGEEYVERLTAGKGTLQEILRPGAGGVTEEEARTLGAQYGAGKASGLRMEGSPEERMATNELQEKMLTAMKKQMLIQLEIARNTGRVSERLHEQMREWANGKKPEEP